MAANHGEGAYEAELVVRLPPEADYNGMERRREVNHINRNVLLTVFYQDYTRQ